MCGYVDKYVHPSKQHHCCCPVGIYVVVGIIIVDVVAIAVVFCFCCSVEYLPIDLNVTQMIRQHT